MTASSGMQKADTVMLHLASIICKLHMKSCFHMDTFAQDCATASQVLCLKRCYAAVAHLAFGNRPFCITTMQHNAFDQVLAMLCSASSAYLLLQLKLSSNAVLSHTELAPTKRQGKTITYGAYSSMPAWSTSLFAVHFENNNPFIRVTKLVRELEVSHWGNVYVDEKYYIRSGHSLRTFSHHGSSILPGSHIRPCSTASRCCSVYLNLFIIGVENSCKCWTYMPLHVPQ